MTYTTEMCCFTVLEARSLKARCILGWFLLRPVGKGSILDLSSWLVDGHLLSVSLHVYLSPMKSSRTISPFLKIPAILG